MSLRDCLNRAVAGGDMDRERAQRILLEYDNAFREFQRSMGYTQADIEAARAVARKARAEAADKRRVMQLQAAASQRLAARQQRHRNIRGDLSPGVFLSDVVHNSRGAGGETLVGTYEAIRRSYRRRLTMMMQSFKANLWGSRRRKDVMHSMGRAMYGESVSDPRAAEMAKALADVADSARLRFNAAGGRIGKRETWGLPQRNDTERVRKATYEDWRAVRLYRNGRDARDGYALDLEAMGQDFNNGRAFTEDTLEVHLHDAYLAIRSDGYSRREASASPGGRAIYNRRTERRFFQPKTYDDWRAYNDRFGTGQDVFRTMLAHLDDMAMDTALMEVFGPNYLAQFRLLGDSARMLAARSQDPSALTKAKADVNSANVVLDTALGQHNAAVGTWQSKMARGSAALRNYLTSAHLGAAIWSSVTDFNYQRVQASLGGFSQTQSAKYLARLVRDKGLREVAHEAGLIFENAVDVGNAVARYEMDDLHVEVAARMADATLRASGLAPITEMQKQAHGLVIMNGVAKDQRVPWSDLSEVSRRFWRGYGITEQRWPSILRAEPFTDEKGLTIVRPQDIEIAGDQETADLYMAAIVNSTIHAVPQQDVRSRSIVEGALPSDTIYGQTIRFMLQFKSFPIKVMIDIVSQVAREANAGRPGSAFSFAANLLIANSILGGIAVQLKTMDDGRDPIDMTTPKFWAAAIAQGGGAGIFGDFFFSDVNRFGGGVAETLAGPGVGFLDDTLRFSVGNARELVLGEDTRAGREFVQLLRNYTPGGSLWYLRLAYEREVLDQLQQVLDPDAAQSFRRRVQSAREYDTQFFAPPGSSVIQGRGLVRAPDIENAFGG